MTLEIDAGHTTPQDAPATAVRRHGSTRTANHVDAHVGARVRERRTELGISQERLAQVLGVAFQQVQKYERGVNRISASRLYEIATVLEVSVAYFFDGLKATGEKAHKAA